jgi:16S rRNA (guanine527-N7)-methyltransferase
MMNNSSETPLSEQLLSDTLSSERSLPDDSSAIRVTFPDELVQQWQEHCAAQFTTMGLEALDDRQWQVLLPQIQTLYNHLLQANAHMNLTRLTSPTDFLYRHVLDSWLFSPWLPQNARVADVGTGAGYPTLPLALLRPDLTLVAIEATIKKATYVVSALELLQLTQRVAVCAQRSEEIAKKPEYKAGFDCVVARAVAPLDKLIPYCVPLVKTGGRFIALKGPNYPKEFQAARLTIHKHKLELAQVKICPLPQLHGSTLLVLEKR